MSEAAISRKIGVGPWQALLVFVLLWAIYIVVGPFLRQAIQTVITPGTTPREIVAFRVALALPLNWLMLGLTLVILRARGQSFSDIGWGKPARLWGWLLAAAIVGFYAWSSFNLPMRPGQIMIDSRQWLSDWSFFRVAIALGLGITSGITEEGMFRGFVISQAKDGRAPVVLQVLLSGLLFGLAHFGWGGLTGHFDLMSSVAAMASTTVFGTVFAIVYVVSGRSLMPVVVGHTLFNFIIEPWMMLFMFSMTH